MKNGFSNRLSFTNEIFMMTCCLAMVTTLPVYERGTLKGLFPQETLQREKPA